MLEFLHWLPVQQRIEYRVASLVLWCQLGLATTYLIDLCLSVSGIASGHSLRSVGSLSPVCSYHIMQTCTFCVNGLSVWNGLTFELRLISRTLSDTFYNHLKTVLFDQVGSASE